MNLKRFLSMGLVMLMIASPLAAQAAPAVTTPKLELSFGDGFKVGTMIKGSTINVKASNTKNYQIKEGTSALRIIDTANVDQSGKFTIVLDKDSGSAQDFTVGSIKPANYNDYEETKTYTIQSNYNSLQKTAVALSTKYNASGSLEVDGSPLAIIRTSEAELKYENGTFTLAPATGELAGLFQGWGSQVTINNFHIGTSETDPTWYKLNFINSSKESAPMTFYPNQRHDIMVDHDNDPATPEIASGKFTYELKNGPYTLRFTHEGSNELLLTVKKPIDVLSEVATKATLPSQSFPSEFFKGTGPGDDFKYITQSFDIRGIYQLYGEKMDLEWTWVPDAVIDKNVVRISGSTEWQRAIVNPNETDVKGKLRVQVTYRNKTLFEPVGDVDIKKTIAEIGVIIHGSGIPAKVTQFSQTVGRAPSLGGDMTKDLTNEPDVPSKKYMNMYRGEIEGFKAPDSPYMYKMQLEFGKDNGCARQLVISSTNPDIVTATIAQGSSEAAYKFGATYLNNDSNITSPTNGIFSLVANKTGSADLTFSFFLVGKDLKPVEDLRARKKMTIEVIDTSPNPDSTLRALAVYDQEKVGIDIAFKPGQANYKLEVGYHVKSVTLSPIKNNGNANAKMKLEVFKKDVNGIYVIEGKGGETVTSGGNTRVIDLVSNDVTRINIIVTAENPNNSTTYTVEIMRRPPGINPKLASIELFDVENVQHMSGFKPETGTYTIDVPYYARLIKPVFKMQDAFGSAAVTVPALESIITGGKAEWAPVAYGKPNKIVITTKSENDIALGEEKPPKDAEDTKTYTININVLDPNRDPLVQSVEVFDSLDKKVVTKPGNFTTTNEFYEIALPYEQSKLKFKVKNTDKRASAYLEGSDGKPIFGLDDKGNPIKLVYDSFSKPVEIPYSVAAKPTYDIKLVSLAEDGVTRKEYTYSITREPPNDDATLKSVTFEAQNGMKPALSFSPYYFNYDLEVPFEVTELMATATANNDKVSSISVNGRKVDSGKPSAPIRIGEGVTVIKIVATAQDINVSKEYVFNVTKLSPSNDSRLKALSVSGTEELKPVFVASKTAYTAVVADKVKDLVVTATPNNKNARIIINGIPAEGGVSGPITPLEVNSRITVEVIAQDNVTKTTYTIDLSNSNMIEKTNNADLEELIINYGAIAPKFKPSITSYDVAVDEETFSIDILADPADNMAEVKVFKGSKEMGDQSGNYSESITNGLTEFSIEVTSSDKSNTKNYNINVYKKDEENMGTLKPVLPEDINYLLNPIVVDITRYSRVDKSVFEELKKHKDKSMIFVGNDYSLEFKASELETVIPQTQVYDFGLAFSSPYLEKIEEEIYSYTSNDDLNRVIFDFKQHTALPGPAKLSMTLGRHYRNDKLYWHDYNVERNRLDYYATLESNAKGTISLKIAEIGSSVVSDGRIRGSENKAPENPVVTVPEKKPNPDTGVRRP